LKRNTYFSTSLFALAAFLVVSCSGDRTPTGVDLSAGPGANQQAALLNLIASSNSSPAAKLVTAPAGLAYECAQPATATASSNYWAGPINGAIDCDADSTAWNSGGWGAAWYTVTFSSPRVFSGLHVTGVALPEETQAYTITATRSDNTADVVSASFPITDGDGDVSDGAIASMDFDLGNGFVEYTSVRIDIGGPGTSWRAIMEVELIVPAVSADVTPPVVTLNGPAGLTLEAGVDTYTEQGASATDDVDGTVPVTTNGSVDTGTPGNYVVTYTAVDAAGNTTVATRTVDVVDTTDPSVSVTVGTGSLWPPNHKMVPVVLTVSASDVGDTNLEVTVEVTSNEPVDGTGRRDASPDWEVTDNGDGTFALSLRAERDGRGSGRIYTITATATDDAGNSVSSSAEVTVPHDRGDGDHGDDDHDDGDDDHGDGDRDDDDADRGDGDHDDADDDHLGANDRDDEDDDRGKDKKKDKKNRGRK
jgi:hypothetical protein